MPEKKHWWKQKLPSLAVTFVLAWVFFVGTAGVVLRSMVSSPAFIINQVEHSGYAAKAWSELQNTLSLYAVTGGFPEDFLGDIITKEMMQADVNRSVQIVFGQSQSPDTQLLYDTVYGHFTGYLTQQGIVIDEQSRQDIDLLTGQCLEEYSRYIQIPGVKTLTTGLMRVQRLLAFLCWAVGGAAIFLSTLLWLLNRWKHRALRYLFYALMVAAVWMMILPFAFIYIADIRNIAILSQAYYALVQSVYTGLCHRLITAGFICLLFALLMAGSSFALKSRLLKRVQEKNKR